MGRARADEPHHLGHHNRLRSQAPLCVKSAGGQTIPTWVIITNKTALAGLLWREEPRADEPHHVDHEQTALAAAFAREKRGRTNHPHVGHHEQTARKAPVEWKSEGGQTAPLWVITNRLRSQSSWMGRAGVDKPDRVVVANRRVRRRCA